MYHCLQRDFRLRCAENALPLEFEYRLDVALNTQRTYFGFSTQTRFEAKNQNAYNFQKGFAPLQRYRYEQFLLAHYFCPSNLFVNTNLELLNSQEYLHFLLLIEN